MGTGLAAVSGWRYARASAPVNGPIIIISIDTLRADHLPVYGYKKGRTPAIDALAADGVVFERAYSHAPETLPAHAALLSGRLPFETGVRDNVGFTVKPGERLLPEMLHDRGYATAGVVSAFVLRKETGIGRGFDVFDADMPSAPDETGVGAVERDGAQSEAVAEHWLDSNGDGRAFLFLHLYEPHSPYAPPDRFSQYAPYDGEIAYSDEIVGTLVRYLKSHQLYDRSTIVLLSDHGEGLGDHGEQEHGLFVYDEAIHIPLIIKQENNVSAGRRVADLVQQIDVVPTILDLVRAPVPGNLHGRTLKPVLDGTGHLPDAPVYSEALYGRYHFGWSELTALTESRYRYIRAPRDELYDLQFDPGERENLAADQGQVRQALRAALDHATSGAAIQPPADAPLEARERLRALGYAGGQTDLPPAPGGARPDPKDMRQTLETYRTAIDLAGDRQWPRAIALLQQIVRDDPGTAEVWSQLAAYAGHVERLDMALDAYKHYIALKPFDPDGYLASAAALMKQKKWDDARSRAEEAVEVAGDRGARFRATGHELLAEIALARLDADTARREAALAHDADAARPIPTYVDARLLYDRGEFDNALPLFEQAIAEQEKAGSHVAGLHVYTAETLVRLERSPEAEGHFAAEIRDFPAAVRARAGLAMLYRATERRDAAGDVITEMTRSTPTPEAYALAARLWTALGNRPQADAVRAEARLMFAAPARSGARAARH
jgi:arylsulfatase A-like enzyme/predicted Zn-dependent protease